MIEKATKLHSYTGGNLADVLIMPYMGPVKTGKGSEKNHSPVF